MKILKFFNKILIKVLKNFKFNKNLKIFLLSILILSALKHLFRGRGRLPGPPGDATGTPSLFFHATPMLVRIHVHTCIKFPLISFYD